MKSIIQLSQKHNTTTHEMWKLYHTWRNMKTRCVNPKHPKYKRYRKEVLKSANDGKNHLKHSLTT